MSHRRGGAKLAQQAILRSRQQPRSVNLPEKPASDPWANNRSRCCDPEPCWSLPVVSSLPVIGRCPHPSIVAGNRGNVTAFSRMAEKRESRDTHRPRSAPCRPTRGRITWAQVKRRENIPPRLDFI